MENKTRKEKQVESTRLWRLRNPESSKLSNIRSKKRNDLVFVVQIGTATHEWRRQELPKNRSKEQMFAFVKSKYNQPVLANTDVRFFTIARSNFKKVPHEIIK